MYATVERDGELDQVAVEEPLELMVDGVPFTVTMRTPGQDEELAAGLLYTEGLITRAPELGPPEDLAANAVDVTGPLEAQPAARPFYSSSACGVCGKGALEQLALDCPELEPGPVVERGVLAGLPERMRQPTFQRTGGLHAAAVFSLGGELELLREDVGRHNALDKVVGRCLLDARLPLAGSVMCVSGRLSFELVSKTVRAGARVLVGVGAPSSLAVELARDRNLTLAGFARAGRVNVYSAPERVAG
ncbi:MAG: formate dehydrogenase accessory sulfurtransferase FdhD [Actinobacteria bacterium]|nr:MAG: formate dehydrogenase accessory sulfurtransferase FdhD [Actinomycetota bacterium]